MFGALLAILLLVSLFVAGICQEFRNHQSSELNGNEHIQSILKRPSENLSQHIDETTGLRYWVNKKTGEFTWSNPEEDKASTVRYRIIENDDNPPTGFRDLESIEKASHRTLVTHVSEHDVSSASDLLPNNPERSLGS